MREFITKAILCICLLFISNIVYAQSSIIIQIPLEDVDDDLINNNEDVKRDLDISFILPVVQYDTEAGNIIIESPYVSFTSVTYCITDENDAVLTGNEIDLPCNCEHNIPLSHLPQGTYYIVLEIDGIRFIGEFEKF